MALKKVTGSECLKYIEKPIGFVSKGFNDAHTFYNQIQTFTDPRVNDLNTLIKEYGNYGYQLFGNWSDMVSICEFLHDTSKRIVGYVTNKYADGGYRVVILGDETIRQMRPPNGNCKFYEHTIEVRCMQNYTSEALTNILKKDGNIGYTEVVTAIYYARGTWSHCTMGGVSFGWKPSLDKMIDYNVDIDSYDIVVGQNNLVGNTFTDDYTNTVVFGDGVDSSVSSVVLHMNSDLMDDPLQYLQGDLYSLLQQKSSEISGAMINSFPDVSSWQSYEVDRGQRLSSFNKVCVPYNLILTENLQFAQEYLANGTLPPDAFLFPLDWDDLPRYNPDDDPDDDDNPDDDDDDGDNGRDIDPTPLTLPTVTPQMLDANNVYWLGVGEYGQFLTWFWFDIQQFSVLDPTTWDNLTDNILGLYNNLAETVIAVRFMPIVPEWVGGLNDTKQPIKLGMIQDYRTHDVFNKYAQLEPRMVGSIDIPDKFNNYKYLNLSPYSQLSLYLPFYGFADLDIDMFTGHKLTVYAVYDILSGSIVYYVYYDDTALVNYYMAKISVDVPITLQTAYDRDRAMNQNITESIVNSGSLLTSIVGGNPIGMTLAAGNLASAPSASAPMLVKGYGSEQGILFTPSKCAIYLRRPTTVKKGSAFKTTVGNLWCRTARLSTLSGYTQCQNPHITFRGNTYVTEEGETTDKKLLPLADEIEEIYDYLQKGVIL